MSPKADVGAVEAARDLLAAFERDPCTVEYRADLWNCLRAALSEHPVAADPAGEENAANIGLEVAVRYLKGAPAIFLAKEIATIVQTERARFASTVLAKADGN